jgi:hypothetical protein
MSMAAPGPYNWSPSNPIPFTWDAQRGYNPQAAQWRSGVGAAPLAHLNTWVGDAQKYAASRGYQLNQDYVNSLAKLGAGGLQWAEQHGGAPMGFNWGAYGTDIFPNQFNPGEAVEYVLHGTVPQHLQGTFTDTSRAPAATQPAAPGLTNPVTQQPVDYQHGVNTGVSAQGTTAAQRMALASDPQQAFRYAMQQAGLNPDAPGLLGNFLKKRFQPLLEARMAAAGVGNNSNYMDTIDSVIRDFGLGLMGKGGGGGSMPGGDFYGGLAGIANQAQQQGGDYLNNLSDQSQAMQYLQQLGSLRFAGANPLVAQSAADVMERTRNQYQDTAFQNELAGRNIDPFTRYLQSQNPFTYRTIYGY